MTPLNAIAAMTSATLGVALDPYRAYNFLVEIDGILSGGFTQAQGLESTIETEDRPEGGVNTFVRKVLKGATSPNLVLSHGLTDLATLWTWFDQTRRGAIQRKNMTVMLLDDKHLPVMWWDVIGALPVRWSGPSFDASQSAIAVESIELVHLGFSRSLDSAATILPRALGSLPR